MTRTKAVSIKRILKKHAAWLDGGNKSGKRANFMDDDLRGAKLIDVNLKGANLRGANLKGATLRGANLTDASLRGANLIDADLRGANLRGADFSYADLIDANLMVTNLTGANFTNASLRGANLMDADLRYANLMDADLRDADLWCCVGDMVHIKSMQCDRYSVVYTTDVMQIDRHRHPIAAWWRFDDARITKMDEEHDALKWWRVWKPILKQIIAASPAGPTGETE